MGAVVTLRLGTARDAATVLNRLNVAGWNERLEAVDKLLKDFRVKGGKLVMTIDSVDSGTVLENVSVTATCAQATTDEDDTVVIGGTTFTWKASPSGESQVDIGVDDATCASNLATAINAHSQLQGVVTASAAAAVCTITLSGASRLARHILLSETGDAVTLSATSFAPAGTLTAELTAPVVDSKGL
jgi:hypothetical protein